MKLQIDYKINKIISIEINDGETVKDLKEKLRYVNKRSSKKPRICAECIVLKYGERILNNDRRIGACKLTDNCTLSMSLSVRYQEQISDSNNSPNNSTIALGYDATVSDMVKQCCDRQNQSDIKVNCGKECKMDDYIRKYMRDKNPLFTITIKDKRPVSKSQTNILKKANMLPTRAVKNDNIAMTTNTNQKEDHSQPRTQAITTSPPKHINNKVVSSRRKEIIIIEDIENKVDEPKCSINNLENKSINRKSRENLKANDYSGTQLQARSNKKDESTKKKNTSLRSKTPVNNRMSSEINPNVELQSPSNIIPNKTEIKNENKTSMSKNRARLTSVETIEKDDTLIDCRRKDKIQSHIDKGDNRTRYGFEISKSISSVESDKVTNRPSYVDLKKNKHEIRLKSNPKNADVKDKKQSYNSMIVMPIEKLSMDSPQSVNPETIEFRKSSTDIHPEYARAKVRLHSLQYFDNISSFNETKDYTKTRNINTGRRVESTKKETVVKYDTLIDGPIEDIKESHEDNGDNRKKVHKKLHPTCDRAKMRLHSPQNMDNVSSFKVKTGIIDTGRRVESTKSKTVVEVDNIHDLVEVPKNEEIQIMENVLNEDSCDKSRIEFQPDDNANKRDDKMNATNIKQDNSIVNPLYSSKDVTSSIIGSEHRSESSNSSSKISLTVVNNLNEDPSINYISIMVDACCSVEDIRKVISQGLSIRVCNFDIYYGDKELLRGNLNEYGISHSDSLLVKPRKLIPNVTEQFVIAVRNTTDDLRTDKEQGYLIDYFQTVESVKRNLREQYNVNIDCIKLFFDGKELHDADVIQELGIPNGSMLEWRIEKIEKTCTTGINIVVRKNLSASDVSGSEQIRVPGDTTIASLRSQLETVFDLSSVKYFVSFSGELLKKENTINTYNIKDGDEIIISRGLLVRYFKGADGHSATVNRFSFLSTDNVSDLKEKITKKLNIPARAIMLTFDGNALDDDRRLEDYDIENDSHVMMIATLSGGISISFSRLFNDFIFYD